MIAAMLARDGVPQTLFVRDAGRAPVLPGADVVVADFRDPASVRAALRPGDRVFMVSVHENVEARIAAHQSFVDAASGVGVGLHRLSLDRQSVGHSGLPPRPLACRDGAHDPRERNAVRVPAHEPVPR